jgi:hypothetical protein
MNHDFDAVEMHRPIGLRTDIPYLVKLSTGDRFCWTSGSAENGMAALDELATQRSANKAGRAGHQDPRHLWPLTATMRFDCASDLPADALQKW